MIEEDGNRVRDLERIPVRRQRPRESGGNNMCFRQVGFLVFIVMFVNCTAEMDRKSHKIEIVGLRGFTAEDV